MRHRPPTWGERNEDSTWAGGAQDVRGLELVLLGSSFLRKGR